MGLITNTDAHLKREPRARTQHWQWLTEAVKSPSVFCRLSGVLMTGAERLGATALRPTELSVGTGELPGAARKHVFSPHQRLPW